MARVKLSGLVSDISGRINGTVFQRNQSGLIMRNQSGNINSNTVRSNTQRNSTAIIQSSWQLLTDNQRLLWQNYSIFIGHKQKRNSSLNINGHQLFIKINSLRLALSPVNDLFTTWLLSTPIFSPLISPFQITSIGIDVTLLKVVFDTEIFAGTQVVAVFISRPLRGSQLSGNQKLTLMKSSTFNGFYLDINDYYITVYGRVPVPGEFVQAKVCVWEDTAGSFSNYSVNRFEIF